MPDPARPDAEDRALDASGETSPAPARGIRFPLAAVRLALLALVLGAVASIVLSGIAYVVAPDAPALGVVAGSVALYGVISVTCIRASRRFGTGRPAHDLGLRFEPADLLRGPLTWLGMNVAAVTIGLAIASKPELQGSNTDVLTEQPDALTLALVVGVAVVCAPFFEELLFRGLLLGALASRVPAWAANGLQSLAFGLVHVRPSQGMGNVGLVCTLAAVGAVLGIAALRSGRLGPSMVAHALFNAVATAATLLLRD